MIKSEKLKENIIAYLTETKTKDYISTIDEHNVDILITNFEMSNAALKELGPKFSRLIVTIPNGNGIPTTKQNPAFAVYQSCIKIVKEMSHVLMITRQDRIKLKLEKEDKTNILDQLKSSYS